MKTILYNPIFINPQAYYVFPQLYNIQKGDQFIEPAVYAGQLMIENLTDNTKVMLEKYVMQVDFTQFAGKHIRINQYTNIGTVVLGEWNIPDGGLGEYAVDFNLWGKSSFITDISSEKVTAKFYKGATPGRRYILEPSKTETVESFNIRYTSNGNRPLEYNYIDADGSQKKVVIPSGTVYTLPKSYTSESAIHLGFSYVEYGDEDIVINITQLPY